MLAVFRGLCKQAGLAALAFNARLRSSGRSARKLDGPAAEGHTSIRNRGFPAANGNATKAGT
jgi:hypothetical protein